MSPLRPLPMPMPAMLLRGPRRACRDCVGMVRMPDCAPRRTPPVEHAR
ncbi:hypothetical protein [Novacetimonas hansenii]|nr:hypothetical protein [Novacetimonas hansenii]